jgi:hypothetical protein
MDVWIHQSGDCQARLCVNFPPGGLCVGNIESDDLFTLDANDSGLHLT